jgi:SAM-dependent methyltransferase
MTRAQDRPVSQAAVAARLERERRFHRSIAKTAEQIWRWDSPTGSRRAERRAAYFVERGGLRPGVRALELGCGTGVFLALTAPSGARLDAVDLSPELLEKARARFPEPGRVRLACGNVEQLPYPDAAFDVVYGSSILHHVALRPTLQEAGRVLKPGGRIVFAEPNLLNPHIAFTFLLAPRRLFGLSADEMAFTRFRVRRVLEELGFEEISVEPYDFLYPLVPKAWIDAVLRVGRLVERTPLREIAGSLLIEARRAGSDR